MEVLCCINSRYPGTIALFGCSEPNSARVLEFGVLLHPKYSPNEIDDLVEFLCFQFCKIPNITGFFVVSIVDDLRMEMERFGSLSSLIQRYPGRQRFEIWIAQLKCKANLLDSLVKCFLAFLGCTSSCYPIAIVLHGSRKTTTATRLSMFWEIRNVSYWEKIMRNRSSRV